jgi:hypothetical protein
MPVTRWEYRSEVVSIPVTRRELVPEVRTVRIPVVRTQIARDEFVVSRVALGVTPSAVGPGGTTVGGIAKLQDDPPRQGSTSSGRRAARDAVRR